MLKSSPRRLLAAAVAAVAAVSLSLFAPAAHAQHANFVLFGANPDAQKAAATQTEEQRFVHPVTGPYFHEDSFVTTDLRLWYAYHEFDDKPLDGHADVAAAQIRIALTDELQLVAYKDGYTWINSKAIGNSDGWNDIAAGVKWNFIHDWKDQFHAAVGAGYQLPWGESKVLGNKEELRLWASANKGFDKLHLGGTINYFFGTGGAEGPAGKGDHLSWHLHADYYLCKAFSPVVELNGYHVTRNHDKALPIQGADVTNLGGTLSDVIITGAIGGEFRVAKNVALRAAWEKDLVGHQNIFDWRVTASAVFSF